MLMVDAKGATITRAIANQLRAQINLKYGDYLDDRDFWAEMHPSQITEWENCGVWVEPISHWDGNSLPPKSFMGFPLESNPHLSPDVVLIRKYREIVAEIGRLGHTNWNMENAQCLKS